MSLIISRGYNGVSDPDAAAYVSAVEAADGQLLENAVGKAINAFVLGCKADGIWSAIKASCILAGARTLNGALVPLVGAAPTNFNFVAGDYNRRTGLVGNGGSGNTKYLGSNRANNADPQNSKHVAVYASAIGFVSGLNAGYFGLNGQIGSGSGDTGFWASGSTSSTLGVNLNGGAAFAGSYNFPGLIGASRSTSLQVSMRSNGATANISNNSAAPTSASIDIYRGASYTNARIAFYSIGESLDLTLLDARVTALINALSAAIP